MCIMQIKVHKLAPHLFQHFKALLGYPLRMKLGKKDVKSSHEYKCKTKTLREL